MRTRAPKPPGPEQLAGLRRLLMAARRDVLRRLASPGDGAEASAGFREAELEERSQLEGDSGVSARLADESFARLAGLDGALHRMVLGKYGVCTHCASPVSLRRLTADPAVAMCSECAAAFGHAGAGDGDSAVSVDVASPAAIPPEFRDLDDAEIASLVHESFREEAGTALASVRVVCRHGRVILAGEVANDGLRQVALRIVGDEMGFDATDRMRVTSVDGETARDEGESVADFDADELALDLSDADTTSDDIFQVDEEGLSYSPPARPVPEAE
jgi:RNA polymerase-binding transcription factor DksA